MIIKITVKGCIIGTDRIDNSRVSKLSFPFLKSSTEVFIFAGDISTNCSLMICIILSPNENVLFVIANYAKVSEMTEVLLQEKHFWHK